MQTEQAFKKLKKVVNPERFRFIIVLYQDIHDIKDIKDFLNKNHPDANHETLLIKETRYEQLAAKLYKDNSIVYIDDFSELLTHKTLYSAFNQRRDKIASYNTNIIAFYPQKLQNRLYKDALNFIPDLWEFRTAVIELKNKKENIKDIEKSKAYNTFTYSGMNKQEKEKEIQRLQKKIDKTKSDTLKATLMNNTGFLYSELGEYAKAQPLYKKALKIRETVLGENHPDTATSYNNLAIFYYHTGDYKKAYAYMQKAVNVREKVLPSNHPHLISSKQDLEVIQKPQ